MHITPASITSVLVEDQVVLLIGVLLPSDVKRRYQNRAWNEPNSRHGGTKGDIATVDTLQALISPNLHNLLASSVSI